MDRRDIKRIHGTKARAPKKGCLMCSIESDPAFMLAGGEKKLKKLLSDMWTCGPDRLEGAQKAVQFLNQVGIGASPEDIRRHYRYHMPEQPAPAGPINSSAAYQSVERLSDRQKSILDMIYRVGMLSTRQVADALYPGKNRRNAHLHAFRDMSEMSRMHLLFRFTAPNKVPNMGRTVWFLGRNSKPWLSRRFEARIGDEHITQKASRVGVMNLPHDLGANDMVLSLAKNIEGTSVDLGDDREASLWLDLDNWWSARHLAFGFYDQYQRQRTQLIADGFTALSLQVPGEPTSELLPCFIEYDRGTKSRRSVARQLLAYHGLGASKAVQERFPDLDTEGLRVPVVMVLLDYKIEGLLKMVVEESKKMGMTSKERHPIFVVGETSWRANPLKSMLISIWDYNHRSKLIPVLRQASKPLVEGGKTDAYTNMRVNPKGGRAGGSKFRSLSQLAAGRG